jgi:hypothetical protein
MIQSSAYLKDQPTFNIGLESNPNNLVWIEILISGTPGVDAIYESRAVLQSDLKTLMQQGINVENIGNANLTLDSNRTLDADNYEFQIINGKRFAFISSAAPTVGEASFSVKGYGTTGSDYLFDIYDGTNNRVFWVNGAKNIYSKAETFYQFSDTLYAEYTVRSNNVSGACQISLQNGSGSIFQIYGNNAGVQIISAQPIQQSIKSGVLGNGSLDNNQVTFGYDNTTNELLAKFKKADGSCYLVTLPGTLIP